MAKDWFSFSIECLYFHFLLLFNSLLFRSPDPNTFAFSPGNKTLRVSNTAGQCCAIDLSVYIFPREKYAFVNSHMAERIFGAPSKLGERYICFDLHLHYCLVVN
tara:strand:- start:756 stop:1067 length:312 start_codon:yes stop_codon:yes gene_type:complete